MQREKLSGRLGFILLSAGCAIGLGNVYRFPIITGAYGGAVFVIIYLAFLVLLGLPVMCCELAVGRASQRSIASSFEQLEKKGQKWHLMKYLGIAGNYILMMFYTTITGWFVMYMYKFMSGSIMTAKDPVAEFVGMISDVPLNVILTAAVIAVGFLVCALGLQKGVERITKVMMASLFLLMLGLAVYSLTLSGASEGLSFYLVPSLASIERFGLWTVISAAMGQAFFTLSLGIGCIAIFGSYIGKERSLLGEGATIIALDTMVALISGLIIFPAFFTANPGAVIDPGSAGAGFLFMTLSGIFTGMRIGRVLGSFFFLFMVFAAMSTVIAVFENIVSFWIELTGMKRTGICLINIVLLLALTMPFVLSNGGGAFSRIMLLGRNIGDFEDFLVSNLALPVGSLVYVVFCTSRYGWGWSSFIEEMNSGRGAKLSSGMKVYMSYILPMIILTILVMSLV
ncbi:MAG: sodium-dependent transporter [Eubacteriales bacterium]|nr:sodium-dependent transporter [Eubacteriales bacterium]